MNSPQYVLKRQFSSSKILLHTPRALQRRSTGGVSRFVHAHALHNSGTLRLQSVLRPYIEWQGAVDCRQTTLRTTAASAHVRSSFQSSTITVERKGAPFSPVNIGMTAFLKGNNDYPKIPTEAYNLLVNYKSYNTNKNYPRRIRSSGISKRRKMNKGRWRLPSHPML